MFRPPLTAKKQENGPLKNAPPTRIAGRCQVAGGRFAATCFILHRFSTPRFTPQYEQNPARISGLTAIPIGTPAKARTRRFKPVEGYGCQLGGKNAPRGAQQPTGRYQAGHICGVSIAVISDSISAANSSRDCPYFFSAVLAHLVQDRLFSSTLSW